VDVEGCHQPASARASIFLFPRRVPLLLWRDVAWGEIVSYIAGVVKWTHIRRINLMRRMDAPFPFGDSPRLTMDPAPKILLSRIEAAEALSLSVSSVDMLISGGKLKALHKGRRVLIHITEIERIAAKEIPRIWPTRRARDAAPSDSPQLTLVPMRGK